MRWIAFLILPAVLLLATACGGGDGAPSATPTPTEVPASPTPAPTAMLPGDGDDSEATTLPRGFQEVMVVGGLDEPTTFAFAPDGRIFIAEKRGVVRVFKEGSLLPTPFVDIQNRVNSSEQRGLLGLAVDPNFLSNGYVYLYYTFEHGLLDLPGPRTGQLIRVTADGDVVFPGRGQVLLGTVVGTTSKPSCEDFAVGADCLPADACCHVGGGLRFASDGKLFLATGDGADTDELRLRPQNLDSLAGKMLRINPDGSGPSDNPYFTGDPADNRSKVWAYGLREPFRFGLQPGTDLPFIGDIGSLFWEEISIAYPEANLGWPCSEGPEPVFDYEKYALCRELISVEPTPLTPPLHSYRRQSGAAVVGGDFALSYPAPYAGAYFFGDFVRSWIAYLVVDDDGNLIDVQEFATAVDGPVAIKTGPDGEIYYLAWNTGEIRHICWVAGNACATGASP